MFIHEGQVVEGAHVKRLLDTLPLAQRGPAGIYDSPGKLKAGVNLADPENAFLPVDHKYVLTGYMGSRSVLKEVVSFVRNQKKTRKERLRPDSPWIDQPIVWICDPVIGDNGKIYVSPELVELYKTDVMSLADIVTPNQYELEWLCGHPIETLKDALDCCKILHSRGVRIVVVTSIRFPSGAFSQQRGLNGTGNSECHTGAGNSATDAAENELTLLASEKVGDEIQSFIIRFPRLDAYLGGTGDLMSAMLLDGLERFNCRLDQACERAIAVLQVGQ